MAISDETEGGVGVLQLDVVSQGLTVTAICLVKFGETLHDDVPISSPLAIFNTVFTHVAELELILQVGGDG